MESISAPMGNAPKVSVSIRRLRRKYLASMENMAIWGYLRTQNRLNVRKVFKHIWRIRGKNLCVHGEDAKRLLAYSPYTPRDIKVHMSPLIIIQI